MTTFLLIVHGLLAVALLGAITHQAASVCLPAKKPAASFPGRFRSVNGAAYAPAVVLLYVASMLLGGLIYPDYRLNIRDVLQELQLRVANGSFELKEHFVALGLGMLPAYWLFWREPLQPALSKARTGVTAMLAFIVWWGFLTGHVVNNIRGFGS
jgi:hypothetical protein